MDSPDPEALTTVAAIVAGAGTSGAIAGVVKNFAPAIAPDIAAAIAGGLLYFFGDRVHPLLKAYGVGVLAGGLKGTIEKAIPPIIGGTPPPATQGQGSTGGGGDVLAMLAQSQASVPVIQSY